MIVGKGAVLVAELIPQRDSGRDDLGLGGSALPFLAQVFCKQRLDNTREVFRDLTDVARRSSLSVRLTARLRASTL